MKFLQGRWTMTLGVSGCVFGSLAMMNARAADGTIHFTGAIVAAPYEASQARASGTRVHSASAGQLVFERQYIDRPSASVQVHAPAGQATQISFTDSNARTSSMALDETKAIGRDGGTVSIRPHSTGHTSLALVTVTYD